MPLWAEWLGSRLYKFIHSSPLSEPIWYLPTPDQLPGPPGPWSSLSLTEGAPYNRTKSVEIRNLTAIVSLLHLFRHTRFKFSAYSYGLCRFRGRVSMTKRRKRSRTIYNLARTRTITLPVCIYRRTRNMGSDVIASWKYAQRPRSSFVSVDRGHRQVRNVRTLRLAHARYWRRTCTDVTISCIRLRGDRLHRWSVGLGTLCASSFAGFIRWQYVRRVPYGWYPWSGCHRLSRVRDRARRYSGTF